MKIYRVARLVTVVILLSAIVSCEKEKNPSRMDMLTNGKWRLTAQTASPAVDWDGDGDTETNLYLIMDACIKDDYAIFRKDGTVEENEGASKCDATDPQSEILNWSFKNNDNTLHLDGDDFIIEQMTESTLTLKVSFSGIAITSVLQKF